MLDRMLRSFHHADFPVDRLIDSKRGRRISVCLPARNEASTVGKIVGIVRRELMQRVPVVDELVVIDDGSSDQTASVAAASGAVIVPAADVLPDQDRDPDHEGGSGTSGKGQALWKGVHATTGDVVVFCDADVENFGPHFVTGLVGPLLVDDDVAFVKGFYRRPMAGRPGEGGRVTELVARPLISMLFPGLAGLHQPLAGECAARRDVFEAVPFVDGYGVDLGLLIDISEQFGAGGIVQCDLGERVHRNRPLSDLGPQAMAILQLALSRAGLNPDALPWGSLLQRPGHDPVVVTLSQRPPLRDVLAERKTA
jgi:glucosyl-3-phosphoglycerate synthase